MNFCKVMHEECTYDYYSLENLTDSFERESGP